MHSASERLSAWFEGIEGSLTAFSGGVDSALVLYLSRRHLGGNAIGVISDSPSLKRSDLQIAREFCTTHGIDLQVIKTRELDDPNYTANSINRCFHCKSNLYADLIALQSRYPGYTMLNGTNADDLGDYRPGLEAARQNAIRSPLAECGIQKKEVRELAHQFGLAVWDKPASPCLSSRIPYGQSVTVGKLQRIEAAEAILGNFGFSQARVRHIGTVARIEVPAAELTHLKEVFPALSKEIHELGFESVQADDEGFVSGKLNRAIL